MHIHIHIYVTCMPYTKCNKCQNFEEELVGEYGKVCREGKEKYNTYNHNFFKMLNTSHMHT